MNRRARLFALGLATAALGTAASSAMFACGHHKDAATQFDVAVSGAVTAESGAPLSNATVLIGGQTVKTDASGAYKVVLKSSFGNAFVTNITADGYAPRHSTIPITSTNLIVNQSLRALGSTTSVALPTGAEPNVALSLAAADGSGGLTLIIPQSALVFADGTVPNGNVDVGLTLWTAADTFATAPAPLVGRDSLAADANVGEIISFGMADISIQQAGKPLQVSTGHQLQLEFAVDANDQPFMGAVTGDSVNAPQLWSADANTGMWVHEGSLGDKLSYDPVAHRLVAMLPHLSAWNVDSKADQMGCVQGKLVDCNKNAVGNTAASLWLMGKGSVGQYTFKTAADGSFCTAIGGRGGNVRDAAQAYYFVSQSQAPNSTVCNPTGRGNVQQLCSFQSKNPDLANICIAGSEVSNESQAWYAAGVKNCGLSLTNFSSCGFCAGAVNPPKACPDRNGANSGTFSQGACTDLGSVTLNNGPCNSVPPPATPTTNPDPCKNKGNMAGQYCTTDADCCAAQLQCRDSACVPVPSGT